MANASNIIISLIFASLIATGFFINMGVANDTYDLEFDNASMDSYQKLSELNSLTEDLKNATESITPQSSISDVLGSIFTSGYQVLLMTKSSFGVFDSMLSQAIVDLKLGAFGETVKDSLYAMFIITLFVGVILAAIIKVKI
jgi:hypothetical protein